VTSLDEEFLRIVTQPTPDPRPVYDRMRQEAPVYRTPLGFWYVTRYDLAQQVIRNPKFWHVIPSSPEASHFSRKPTSFALTTFRNAMNFTDDPRHRFLRKLVGDFFTPAAVGKLRGKVSATVTAQLDELPADGAIDFKHDLADLLPTRVILDLLGIDHRHTPLFVEISAAMAAILEPTATPATIAAGDAVWREAAGIVRETAADREREPRDDLLTGLLAADADGERLNEDDLLATVLSLAVAGHETTANMLVNTLHHLLRQPELLADLRDDRTIMGSAIEEFLRYESPPRNSVSRYPVEDVSLGGVTIRRDEQMYVGYQAANHDPAEFASPHILDLRRSPNRHLGLGIGVHHCLGAALARLEMDIALNALLDRYPSIRRVGGPAGEVRWKAGFVVRSLESLPLLLGVQA
jgi:cytochrome P450